MNIKNYECEVLEIKEPAKNVRQFKFSRPKDFSFLPGQYVNIKIPGEKEIRRSYSTCSSPDNMEYLEICCKKVENGPGTTYLFSLNKGNKIEFLGPIGNYDIDEKSDERLIFISTGTGIAPIRCIINHLLQIGYKGEIILLAGYRYEDSILFDDEFKAHLEKHSNFKYYPILSQAINEKDQGHVQDLIDKYVEDKMQGNFYICGVKNMINDSSIKLKEKAISAEKIHLKSFG